VPEKVVTLRMAALFGVLVAAVLVPFALFGPAVEQWTVAALAPTASKVLAGVVIFGLLAADIFAPVPSSLLCVAAGAALGAAVGTLVAAAGLSCGCVTGFWLARRVGVRHTRRLLGDGDYEALEAALRRHGLVVLVLCRPVPVLAEVSVLVAGAASLARGPAVAVTTAANIGVAAAYALLGASADGAASFLLVFAASCLLPALAWVGVRLLPRTGRP
jgi:uncharacterized membrane protein YdjX (TVP38/TMEM64 family)